MARLDPEQPGRPRRQPPVVGAGLERAAGRLDPDQLVVFAYQTGLVTA